MEWQGMLIIEKNKCKNGNLKWNFSTTPPPSNFIFKRVGILENSSTVWSWEIHVFTNLYPSVESSPRMKKTQRRWPESFQSQEQIDERTWHRITDWLGLETMVWIPWISVDPYQGVGSKYPGRMVLKDPWCMRVAGTCWSSAIQPSIFCANQLHPKYKSFGTAKGESSESERNSQAWLKPV